MNLVKTGDRFGRLKVLRKAGSNARGFLWECQCDCGTIKICRQIYLRTGDTKSCGCLKRDVTIARNTTHGCRGAKAYTKWSSMWGRVRYPRGGSSCYAGVKVCKRWEKFENFHADMGDPPNGFTLERKNPKRGYSPSNCEWVPAAKQAQNTTRTVWVIWEGVSMCLSEAARRNGLAPDLVFDRLKLGWDIDTALSTPKRKMTPRSF